MRPSKQTKLIRVENTYLPVVALTHPGMKGKNNEDRFGVSAFRMEAQPATPVLLAVLSDGIGGHRAGEVASEIAVNVISQYVADSDGRNPPQILQEAIHKASQTIHEQARENIEQQGMGATCACVWISGDRLFTATVGDSRIYLMRNDYILQLSVDHTWIQEALEHGLIQPDQINGHPNAHVIRRYLGSPMPPEVDFRMRVNEGESDSQSLTNQGLRLLANDRILLCSDGLTDLVNDEEILAAFQSRPLEEAGNYLIELANQRGGHDNITLIGVQVPMARPAAAAAPKTASSFPRMFLLGCLGAIVLGVIVGGLLGGWILFVQDSTPTNQAPTSSPSVTVAETRPNTPTTQPTFSTATYTLPPVNTPSPGLEITLTGTPLLSEPSLTPWPTNTRAIPTSTPTAPLPVVTVMVP